VLRTLTSEGSPDHPHRLAKGGYELQHASTVATRRQTVDVFLATPTAWQRVATRDTPGRCPGLSPVTPLGLNMPPKPLAYRLSISASAKALPICAKIFALPQ